MTLKRCIRLINQTGAAATITGDEFEITDRDESTRFHGILLMNDGGGTTPTLDVVIQTRPPGGAWRDFITFDQRTSETADTQNVPVTSIADMPHWLFRAVATMTGTGLDYDVTVDLWYGPG